MLQFKIRQQIEATGQIKVSNFLRKVCGFSIRKTYTYSKHEQKSITLHDLSVLCEMLNCTPNELFYWEQTPSSTLPDTHPCISQLTPPPAISSYAKLLKQVPYNNRAQLYDYVQALVEGKE